MRKYILFIVFGFLMALLYNSCSDDTFCIDEVNFEKTEIDFKATNFTLPDGEVYEDMGVTVPSIEFGEYNMTMKVVRTDVIEIEGGANVTLAHFFYDEEGNSFWSVNKAVFTNTGLIGQATTTYVLDILDGTGDFECANGDLTSEVSGDFIMNKIDFKLTGEVCGGC